MLKFQSYFQKICDSNLPMAKRLKKLIQFFSLRTTDEASVLNHMRANQNLIGMLIIEYFNLYDPNSSINIYGKQMINEYLKLFSWYLVDNREIIRQGWQFNAFFNIIRKLIKPNNDNKIHIQISKLMCLFIILARPEFDSALFDIVHQMCFESLPRTVSLKQINDFVIDIANIPIDFEYDATGFLYNFIVNLLRIPFEIKNTNDKLVMSDCKYVLNVLKNRICKHVFHYDSILSQFGFTSTLKHQETCITAHTGVVKQDKQILIFFFYKICLYYLEQLDLDTSKLNEALLHNSTVFLSYGENGLFPDKCRETYLQAFMQHRGLLKMLHCSFLSMFNFAGNDHGSISIILPLYSLMFSNPLKLHHILLIDTEHKKAELFSSLLILFIDQTKLIFNLKKDDSAAEGHVNSVFDTIDLIFESFVNVEIRKRIVLYFSNLICMEKINSILSKDSLQRLINLFLQKFVLSFPSIKSTSGFNGTKFLFDTIIKAIDFKQSINDGIIQILELIFQVLQGKMYKCRNSSANTINDSKMSPKAQQDFIQKSPSENHVLNSNIFNIVTKLDTKLAVQDLYCCLHGMKIRRSISQNRLLDTAHCVNNFGPESLELFEISTICDLWVQIMDLYKKYNINDQDAILQILHVYERHLIDWIKAKNVLNAKLSTNECYQINYKIYLGELIQILNNPNFTRQIGTAALKILCRVINEFYGHYILLNEQEESSVFGIIPRILNSDDWSKIQIIFESFFSTIFSMDCKKKDLVIENMLDCLCRPGALAKIDICDTLAFYHNINYMKSSFSRLNSKIDKFITTFSSEFSTLESKNSAFLIYTTFNMTIKSIENDSEFHRDMSMLRNLIESDSMSYFEALELLIMTLDDTNASQSIITYILTLMSATIINQGEDIVIDEGNFYKYSKYIMILFRMFFNCSSHDIKVFSQSIQYTMKILGEQIINFYQINSSNQRYFDVCNLFNWAASMINQHFKITSFGNHLFDYEKSKDKILADKDLVKTFLLDNKLVQFYRQKSESGEFLCFESSSGHSCIKISKEEIESKGLSAEVLLSGLPSEDTLKPTEDPTNIEIAQYKQNNNDLFDELYNSFKDVDFIDKNLLKSIECYKNDNNNNRSGENNAKFELKSDSDIIIPTFTKLDIGCSIQGSFISTIRSQQRSEDNLLFVEENSKSKRDISHLSGLKTLESHKFAIMFVDYCQNTETDIFSNQKASQKFNNFLESLGIFTAKEGNKIFIQYIDMSISLEIHVSTILCLDDVNKKKAFIGNDKIHVVWSENKQKYDKKILKTQFADLVICIYPINKKYYQIELITNDSFKGITFGPLFHGAIVDEPHLKHSLLATIICASRKLASLNDKPEPHAQKRIKAFENMRQKYSSIISSKDSLELFYLK